MRKSILLAALSISSIVAFGQDAAVKEMQSQAARGGKTADTSKAKKVWKTGGTFSINFGQGGSRNWAAGAEKYSFSLATYASLYANRQIGKWSWDNTLDLGYAFVNTSTLGTRKNDDKIDLFSKLGRNIAKDINLSIVGSFRSQFTDGTNYDYLGQGLKRRNSGFFAPAYFTLAPGIDIRPTSYFSVFISPISARLIVVTNKPKSYYYQGGVIPAGGYELPLSTLYGVDPTREVRAEMGGFVSINFNKEVVKNVNYKSRLDLYSNYLTSYRFTATGPDQLAVTETKSQAKNVDVFWTNTISMKVNKWLQVTYNFDLIYDDDVKQFGPNKNSAGTQMRSLLGVGVAAKF
ncbi:MAG: DUF3078 domain-containing protein [Chitinophagaceae bacterium]|nr:DUF3078 domain-containing protein [Chitinophagaceae bacterium]